MPEPRPDAFITLADGERVGLRYDFNALADIEEETGRPFADLLSAGAFGLSSIRLLVWAGSGGRFATPRDAGAALAPSAMAQAGEAIAAALTAAFPQGGAVGKADAAGANRPNASTAKASSRRPSASTSGKGTHGA